MQISSGDLHPHYRALDGLRGVAILGVFYYHVYLLQLARIRISNPLWIPMPLADFGATGVDLFFVLSGFLITGILIRARRAVNYYSAFYIRRALRLAPLYYLAVILTFGLHWIVPAAHSYPAEVQIWFWLDFSNFYGAFHPDGVQPLGHFWTLAIEEQFYLIWPWIVMRLRNLALLILTAIVIPCGLLLRLLPSLQAIDRSVQGAFLYRFTPTHSSGLFMGSAVAILLAEGLLRREHLRCLQILTPVCLGLTFVADLRLGSPRVQAARMLLLCVGYACLIAYLALARGDGRLSILLSSLPFRLAGRYSYCMYVVHLPLLQYAESHAFSFAPTRLVAAAEYLSALLLCVAIAALSWKVLEEPILSLKRHFPYRNQSPQPA
jgi:peptidoglycan/LPS O-acetylase OafA/YrhL